MVGIPPRKIILLEQRQRIIQALEDVDEDYLTVTATIGVNLSTARGIVARYLREGRIAERPRGGANHVRVDDEIRICLNDILNENCLLTPTQINQELRQRLPRKPTIHDRTVARTLEGARMEERAYRQVCSQLGRNVSVALEISPTKGLVFHSAFLGGMNGQRFNDFLSKTRLNLDPNEHVIFIYDGAPAHNNPAIPGPNSELKKLPPYSPFLNIVEQAISALKAAIKADISRPEQQEQMNNRAEARRQGIALGNFRTQLLLQALQRNIGTITAAKCGQWYRFMQTYIPRCLNNEEIEG